MSFRQRASQPRKQSLVESLVNVAVGAVINITAQAIFFPLFGIHIAFTTNLEIAAIFTVISIARSFLLRRAFNRYHVNRI